MNVKWPLEMIEWDDASGKARWHYKKDKYEPERCFSVGWVVQDDDNVVVVAAGIGRTEKETIGDVTIVPKGMVISRKRLTPAKRRG